ncbi:putative mannosyl-oligosaccharide alpha-1,2-mannosidase 1B [Colletotrichum chlorophyti]|uniref:alpha-1,2-Mannosidase n=1 Tax=Colletotrichum chlorophyti TaxID=708187 RepID=A0A1Q8RLC3_9PEZI|nr:putative mannosyl-oligosaccharide alpha-1,2-mannosidase 1B [Colletotrichum chlorophyti]
MHVTEYFLAVAGLLTQVSATPQGSPQAPVAPAYTPHPERANAVKEAFQRSWNGYRKFAFPNDTLKPVSDSSENDRNGWGASAVDALSTAIIMENKDVVGQILDFVPTINFNVTKTEVSVFETTIRYLGGLVSGEAGFRRCGRHDLLKGPLKDVAANQTAVDALLTQARRLADNLKVAFDTPTGVPDNILVYDPKPRKNGSETNGIATIGTLVLEWTRLSDKIGDKQYGDLSQKGENFLLKPNDEVFPGLLGTDVFISNGTFADRRGGWNGGTDSFYEYLIKMWVYDQSRFALYKDRWIAAADSSIKFLASHPTSRPELTFLAAYNDVQLRFISSHHQPLNYALVACFDGGNFVLGGLVLKEQKYVDFGIKLTEACRETYKQTATAIGPEIFRWQDSKTHPNKTTNPSPPLNQTEFYRQAGFWIRDDGRGYVLRPEVIESYYYAYRATGDAKYQDWAWDAFLAINKTCSVGSGFSSITNVNDPNGGAFDDFQESFWFAEVLKYSYLIQATDSKVQVEVDNNKWVFNTEAHPFQVA